MLERDFGNGPNCESRSVPWPAAGQKGALEMFDVLLEVLDELLGVLPFTATAAGRSTPCPRRDRRHTDPS